MYNFHYPKIIVTVGSALAKETVLSKIMNFVDGFAINLSLWFDDKQKKYIDTILKLDNSKTIMLETKGWGITVKNSHDISLSKGDTIKVDFSEYLEEEMDTIFMDYAHLKNIDLGAQICFVDSDLVLEVTAASDFGVECDVISWWSISLHSTVYFKNYDPQLSFLNQKDKKDIQWGLQWGIHIMVGSSVRRLSDLTELRNYLTEQRSETKKIIARIETQEALDAYSELIGYADGVILVRERLAWLIDEAGILELASQAKLLGKSVIVTVNYANDVLADAKKAAALFASFIGLGIDGYMLWEETAEWEEPLEVINGLYELLDGLKPETIVQPNILPFYENSDRDVIDYILHNVYRVVQDLDIRAVVCYTNTWYTAARLASFRPMLPVIAFTKSDDSYRYVNTLRGVKGYKISHGFDYENLKKIGKEMIRMMFKGSISLDEKIVIVQVNEQVTDQANMINGMELYRFKDI